jgi:hypothetical protein
MCPALKIETISTLIGQVPVHPEHFCANTFRPVEGYCISKNGPFEESTKNKQTVSLSVVGRWSPPSAKLSPFAPSRAVLG